MGRDLDSFQPGAHTRAGRLFDGSREFVGGNDCGLSDGSVLGDWRLPSSHETSSLFQEPEPVFLLAPGVFLGQLRAIPSGGTTLSVFWSSTPLSDRTARCFRSDGIPLNCLKSTIGFAGVWPVRTAL